MIHVPVLLNEVLKYLDPKPGKFIIDGTTNGGGHTREIIKLMLPEGKYLAIDLDKELIQRTEKEINSAFNIPNQKFKIVWKNANYREILNIITDSKLGKADGLVIDLGFSSEQIENSGRGFSFRKKEPIDMRYDREGSLSAYDVVNKFSESELSDIFFKYGEERYSRGIAREIVKERKLNAIGNTFQLVEIIKNGIPRKYEHGRIHFATRTFQALRIFVNDELGNLENLLKDLNSILRPNGVAVVISFHSLEDRIVKNYFREMKKNKNAELLTKKPITASEKEILINPKSRGAKLRAIKII